MGMKRDELLEKRLLRAVIGDRNDDPRKRQRQVGPSSIGFCRELLRANLFEAEADIWEPESHWATAAHVGTAMGDALEDIFAKRMDALTQQRVTAALHKLGVSISGAIDLLWVEDDMLGDLKSTADMGGVIYDMDKNAELIESLLELRREGTLYNKIIETPDGSYELTDVILRKLSKLQYFVQQATYVAGCIQAGILSQKASARLVFYDRSGNYQEFVVFVLDTETLQLFFDIGQERIRQVVEAQDLLEKTGNPALIHHLRDQTPSFCFSAKVMCPLRNRCWGGTEWSPEDTIAGADLHAAIERYDEGRRLENLGKGMRSGAREELKGIQGRTEDGWIVGWRGNTISVVRDRVEKEETEDA